MKLQTQMVQFCYLIVTLFFLCSCVPDKAKPETDLPEVKPAPVKHVEKQNQLPVQYQTPSYMVDTGNKDNLDEIVDDVAIKVGASIRSTQGPQPLWDILKRLAALKKMSVSWASDVDQNALVDVDISANDDFYSAIDNLLRQVDYYHEMNGSTIVVHYKETRQFHIAMPFTKQLYETATGGNVLGSSETANNIEGTIRLDSRGNEFDIWKNIQDNMDAILDTWSTTAVSDLPTNETTNTTTDDNTDTINTDTTTVTRQVSASGNKYTIDKPVGIITVHAPRPLLNKLDIYFKSLKTELYKQISIEAKIVEVQLTNESSYGLNWNMILKSLSMGGQAFFNKGRSDDTTNTTSSNNTWSHTFSDTNSRTGSSNANSNTDAAGLHTTTSSLAQGATSLITDVATSGATSAIGSTATIVNTLSDSLAAGVSLAAFTFDTFLNIVKEQGETTILSNPKLSVMNGQPALITVGRNVTYIDSITSQVTGTGSDAIVNYTVETERILSGVGLAITANILNDDEVIMNLVPVTSELLEPIEYREGPWGEIGLPIVNVREMSTTVRIKDGEMLVVGGLIASIDQENGTFMPGLGSIPGLRYLFGNEKKVNNKRELIILLKPRIL